MDILRVWAPRAEEVELVVDGRRRAMAAEAEGWWRALEPPHGQDYAFLLDGQGPFPDPRSPWQPAGVDGPSRRLDHSLFASQDQGWQAPPLEEAEVVFIHDPQPAALMQFCPNRKGRWVWRCHIDASRPYRPVWRYLRQQVAAYDASVFSLPDFAQSMPHPEYIIPPSIDPLSEKNIELPPEEIDLVPSNIYNFG